MSNSLYPSNNEKSSLMETLVYIIDKLSDIAKNYVKSKKDYFEKNAEAVEMFERICVHTENGKFPDRLFIERAPNQTEQEFKYIKANYKTITYPIWSKFTSQLNRIWNDNNWSIKWNEQAINAGVQDYIENDFEKFGSVENYFKNIVTYTKEKDPNAFICIKPYELPIVEDENGDITFDETELIEPYCVIYNSKKVVHYSDDILLVLTDEASECQGHNGKKERGLVFELYTKNEIFKMMQYGKQEDYLFEDVLYYTHNLGYLPCTQLKAVPMQREEKVIYQSSFYPAVDVMDEMLLDNSYLKAAKAGHAFPHKWEYVDECNFSHPEYGQCTDGYLYHGEEGRKIKCMACGGSGKNKPSVMGVYQIKTPTKFDDSSKDVVTPPAGFFAPDTMILEFLRSEIDKNKKNALEILNLSSTSDVQGSETALGKMVDREDAFAMIMMISNQLFECFEFTIQTILDMRYGMETAVNYYPTINYPKNFNIRSEVELTNEIGNAKALNLPEIAYKNLTIEYMNRRFSDSGIDDKIIKIVSFTDRIMTLTSLEIAQKKATGSIANWEDILHTSIYQFIAEEMINDTTFIDKPLIDQKKILIDKAKAVELSISNPSAEISVKDKVLNSIANGGGE